VKISFICNYIEINGGWSPWDTRIGGSEESIVEWARELNKRGHKVQVFHNGKHGDYEDVAYKDHSEYEPGDVTINVNYPEFDPQGPTIYFTSLTKNPDLSKFDYVCVLSDYAKKNTGVVHDKVKILPLGYNEEEIHPDKKIAKQCFYASSPDRGLDVLIPAWEQVHKAHPDATLIVTYGGVLYMDGVMNLGQVDEDTMNDIYRTSDIWCHPCTGGELYCITGKKAQASGCIPVIIPTMALDETVKRGYKTTKEDYAKTLIEVLDTPMAFRDRIRNEVIKHADVFTWEQSTDRLIKIIQKVV